MKVCYYVFSDQDKQLTIFRRLTMKKVFTKEEFIQRARLIEKVLFESERAEIIHLPIVFSKSTGEYGAFWFTNGRADRISYSKDFLVGAYELDDIDDTIAHELIHYLIYRDISKSETHGPIFREIYKRFTGRNYASSKHKKDTADESVLIEHSKHAFKCEGCGQLILRSRASNFTKGYKHYTCGECGDKFKKLK